MVDQLFSRNFGESFQGVLRHNLTPFPRVGALFLLLPECFRVFCGDRQKTMRFSNSLFTAAALWGLALLPLGHSRKLPGKISSQKGGGSQKDGGQKGTARIADVGEVRQTMSLVDTLIAEGDFTYLVVIAETLGLQDQLGALQISKLFSSYQFPFDTIGAHIGFFWVFFSLVRSRRRGLRSSTSGYC